MSDAADDRLRRWRLVLGGDDADGTDVQLDIDDAKRDAVLKDLYGDSGSGSRKAGLAGSAPKVSRWLGDIRSYFPTSVVQVMQRDAMDRLGLRQLVLEPELLATVQPDVGLVSVLLGLNRVIPERSRETARMVVRKVTDDLEARLASPLVQAMTGALNRAARTTRPRAADIDWNRTVLKNLGRYQPEHKTVIPERLVGHGRRSQQVLRDIVLCIDQSGSMADSIVHATVMGAVMASLRSVDTKLVVFDTSVVDLTDHLDDPVELLLGVQLGGGTDIAGALAYCDQIITRPKDTILVLISDLFEGGVQEDLLRRAKAFVESGVQMIALLALSDSGAPSYDHENAEALAALGIPAFACTPDMFPEVMAEAIERQDIRPQATAAANDA